MKTLRRYMDSNGLNQEQMAKQLGVDKFVMCKWLGKKRVPSNASLQKIAQITGAGLLETMREWGAIK